MRRLEAVTSPYDTLHATAFWRTGAVDPAPAGIDAVYRPKFPVTRQTRVATQGSCFSQHLGREFVKRGFNWFDAEPGLAAVPEDVNRLYNYGVFTFRTGNIYTPRLLRQWLSWASGETAPPDEVWADGEGVRDPFRPRIEPEPYPDADAMARSRDRTLSRMNETLKDVDLFVFTLGLTEAWEDRRSGIVYPMCPGAVGGSFDADSHALVNYRFPELTADLEAARAILKQHNPAMTILFTVSPVPMVATATGQHVLVANGRTKSTLRAAAADLAERFDDVDYFPGFELVREPPFGNAFFERNLRAVTPEGVSFVMDHFFRAHLRSEDAAPTTITPAADRTSAHADGEVDDLVCEEVMLDASAPR